MSDGRILRLAAILFLVVLPVAGAAAPQANQPAADGTDAQEITDMAADANGQFVGTVVAFDATKTGTGGLLGGTAAGSNPHRDVYLCDYGSTERQGTGGGCRGIRHQIGTIETPTPNAPQRIDVTFVDVAGRSGRYLVAGPDARITLWGHGSDTPLWSHAVGNNQHALNVSIAHDASRAVVGVAPPTGGGSLEIRYGQNGTVIWTLPLENLEGAAVRPTSLDQPRGGGVVAIGTSNGLLFANPDGPRPTGQLGGIQQTGAVHKVVLSNDGAYVAAASANGAFLARVTPGAKPSVDPNTIFNRGLGEPAQDVALAGDGSRFAAAAGSKIYFFRRLETAQIAEPIGQPYDAGARISSLDYDEKGQLLVAVAGNNVLGFGPNKNTPMWTFDGTQSGFGALDGPLRRVAVSDDAQRIVVAGRTKTMAYGSTIGVSASLASATGQSSLAPTQTVPLALTVKNSGSLADNYSFVVTTPVGWPSASADGIRLDPEEVGTVRFNVTAPAGQAPGVYGVQVRVRSETTDLLAQRRNQPTTHLASPSTNLTIPRSVVLKVEAPDDRLLLRQGGEQTVVVSLHNEGNAEGVVNLTTRQELTRGASWDVQFVGGDQHRVPPSGTSLIRMVITAPSDAGSGDRNIITIRAREGENVEATDQVTAYVDAQFGAELRTNRTSWEFFPGQTQTVRVNITNNGNTEDLYNLTHFISPRSVDSDWRVSIETNQITIQRGQTKSVIVTVKAVASDAREATLTVESESTSSPDKTRNQLVLNLLTIPRPPTEEKDRLLPALGPLALLGALALLALARRGPGGRR